MSVIETIIPILLLIGIPFLSFLFQIGFEKYDKIRQYIIWLLASEIIANLFVVICWAVEAFHWTVYEYLLIDAMVSGTIDLVYNCKYRKSTTHRFLRWICYISIVVFSYSVLTYGQAVIHSDTATATLLARSQVKHKSIFPATWNYANGDIWTIGLSTYTLPFTMMLSNQSLARMLGTLTCFAVCCTSICFLFKRIFKSEAWLIAIPIFLVFLNGQKQVFTFQGAYAGNVFSTALILISVYAFLVEKKKKYAIIYFIFSFIWAIGGVRFFAEKIIPLIGTLIIWIYLNSSSVGEVKSKERNEIVLLVSRISFLILPAVLGLFTHHYLSSYINVNNTSNNGMMFESNIERCWSNINSYFLNYFKCFGYIGETHLFTLDGIWNLISMFSCACICFIIPTMQLVQIKKEGLEGKLFSIYGLIHNAIIFIMIVFTGITTERYVLSSIFICVIISSRFIFNKWIVSSVIRNTLNSAFFSILVIIQCLVILQSNTGWKEILDAKKSFAADILQTGVLKGYASYWNSYASEIYTDLKVHFGAVSIQGNRLYDFRWLVDSEVYNADADESVLLLSSDEYESLHMRLESYFGEPIQITTAVTYSDDLLPTKMYILKYNHDIVEDFCSSSFLPAAALDWNEKVEIEDRKVKIHPDGIVYGPYVDLQKGKYTVTFLGSNLISSNCDIHSLQNNEAITYEEVSRDNDTVVLDLDLKEDVSDIEYRAFNTSAAEELFLTGVKIEEAA